MNTGLKDTPVLVHPDLAMDPAQKQNHVGVISHTDLVNDDVFVSFGDEQGLYAPDALLVFRPQEEIHHNLAQLNFNTEFSDIKALTQIDLYLRYGAATKKLEAMAIARDNKNIQAHCLDTLQNQIDLRISNNYER